MLKNVSKTIKLRYKYRHSSKAFLKFLTACAFSKYIEQ